MPTSSQMLSVSAVARRLNISSSSVQRLCNRGLLEFEATQGGHRRISLHSLTRLIEDQLGKGVDGHVNPHLFEQPAIQFTVTQIAELLLQGAESCLVDWLGSSLADPLACVDKLENQLYAALIELDARFVNLQLDTHCIWLAMNTANMVLEKAASLVAPMVSQAPWAIGGAVGGTHNGLAMRFVELGLRLCEYRTLVLSVDATPTDVADAVWQLNAKTVWVSHAHLSSDISTIQWHRKLADKLPPMTRVLVGGGALSPAIRRQLPPHTYYESIAAMIAGETAVAKRTAVPKPHFHVNLPLGSTDFSSRM